MDVVENFENNQKNELKVAQNSTTIDNNSVNTLI